MKKETDDQLWQQAKARADFKTHFTVYLIINASLWLIWFFTGSSNYPWPVWPTLGWGIGVLFNYLGAYKFTSTVEREYEKLKREKE